MEACSIVLQTLYIYCACVISAPEVLASLAAVEMPTLVTCKDRRLLEMEWNAASDDFVIPAVGSIVFNLFR